jgi:hypothetical protein
MRFANPPKFPTSTLLITFVLLTQFIFPGKYPLRLRGGVSTKGNGAPISAAKSSQIILSTRFVDPGHALASHKAPPLWASREIKITPDFSRFIRKVADGRVGMVRGVYAAGVLALRVVQQPVKDWKYVSGLAGDATEFQNAAQNGITGLLAHNYLSGNLFYKLKPGDEICIVFGDGNVKYYRVSGIYEYQKVDPDNLSSKLIDLASGTTVSSGQVFDRFYNGTDHVTLQTCLEKNGVSTWGLYFVVALPESPNKQPLFR